MQADGRGSEIVNDSPFEIFEAQAATGILAAVS
jgi:hypothetical protein